ncbi:MAG: pyridoxal-phosphate dependent enzyme [Proteobacteria bacterium]|nr:pyridoxal-phosphate dependent enzyme [Pseudomonadota bacterium]
MKPLHQHTPLLVSHSLSALCGREIYLKYEALQPSGSFKDRGVGALCMHYAKQGVNGFISSSGGNAGMAVAFASKALNIPAKVIIPITTPTLMKEKLMAESVEVIIEGENWDAADLRARTLASELGYAYIPPFDHPVIWQGYISLIEELKQDNVKPDAIIVSVGGGGLFSGLIQGLHSIGWQDVAIITAETVGAASLFEAVKQNKRVKLDKIDTVAVTLGAKQICQQAFEWTQKHPVFPQTVTDKEAVNACLRFADDHRLLVEPACGASLALLYDKRTILEKFKTIVVIVCGGSGVNLNLLSGWKKQFGL